MECAPRRVCRCVLTYSVIKQIVQLIEKKNIEGVQELMYSATSTLLCLSFAYRFRAIESSSGKRSNQVIRSLSLSAFLGAFPFWLMAAVAVIFINSPLIPLYHLALTLEDPLLEEYRARGGHVALSIQVPKLNYVQLNIQQ